MLHVWNMCLHLLAKHGPHVDKYSSTMVRIWDRIIMGYDGTRTLHGDFDPDELTVETDEKYRESSPSGRMIKAMLRLNNFR